MKWNLNNLKKPEIRNAYRVRLDRQLQEEKIDGCMKIDEIWKKLKDGIVMVAEEIYREEQQKQNWMNSEILHKMEERRQFKVKKDEAKYKKLKHEIQKLCCEAMGYYECARKLTYWVKYIANYCIRKLKSYDRTKVECCKRIHNKQ